MESALKSRFSVTLCILLAGNLPASVMAQVSSTGDAGRNRQVAYLTPMVDLQRSRDIAQAAYQSMQFASALPQYQTLSQSTAANAKDFYWLGETYFHLNRFREAAQAFERAVAMDPRMDSVHILIVQSYLGSNQPQVAASKCSAALNVVSDPIIRQQLSSLAPFCRNQPPSSNVNFKVQQRMKGHG
jgi:cytochrome c-type biogenesis protein CcmH/NrfG